MASTGLRDVPITKREEENLDIAPYVDSLAQFIMECDTPMTIAIQGDWGSGKTSMMNLVKADIDERYPGKMCSVWFNTWQYSQFNAQDQLGISLLSRFASEVSGKSDSAERIKRILGSLGKSLARNLAFVGTMAFTGSAEGAKDAQEAVNGAFDKDFIQSLTELKASIVNITTERLRADSKDRIVVFIDDLDRLAPERAVELLEVFKLFLDVPGCVFVLACDYQVIAQGLKRKFGIGESDLKGRSFFDKMIQLPFSMPVGLYDTRRYTSDLLAKIGIDAGSDLEMYRRLISASVGLNPRSMKRLFNAFQLINLAAEKKELFKDADDAALHGERLRILLACLCLQTSFEPVYCYLVSLGQEISGAALCALKGIDPASPEEYRSLVKDMGGEHGSMVQRLPDFMEAFIEAIQLVSDGSDDLSKSELDNLVKILSFSSITATTPPVTQQDGSERDSLLLKSLLLRLASEVNEEFGDELGLLGDEFKLGNSSRKGKAYGELVTPVGFRAEKQKRVQITCEFRDRGEPRAGVYLSSASRFDWLCRLAEEEFGSEVLYQEDDRVDEENCVYYVGSQEFSEDQPFEEKLKLFEGMVRECLALVIRKLVELRRRG
jgi:hypothetical protein